MGTGSFSGVKRPGRGGNHPPHLTPKLKKEYNYTSTPLLGFHGLLMYSIIMVRGKKLGVRNMFYLLHTCPEWPWDPHEYPVRWEPVFVRGGKGVWACRWPRISIWLRKRFRMCTTVLELPLCDLKACHREKLYCINSLYEYSFIQGRMLIYTYMLLNTK